MTVDIYNRVLHGRILSIDVVRCLCKVLLTDKAHTVTCQLCYPFVSGNSGIRFMPKGGEEVLVAFSPIGVPRIIGFVFPSSLQNTYAENEGTVLYRKLSPGDIVLYAGTGGAEIYLSDSGNVEIGSGVTAINLDTVRRSVEFVTGMIKWTMLSGVDLSAGYVVRNIAGTPQRFPGLVEYRVDVNNVTGRVAGLKMGDVIDDLGIPELGWAGLPKRFSLKSYLGILPIGEIYSDAGGGITVQANRDVSVVGGIVYLGTLAAAFSAVKGEVLVAQMQSLISAIASAFGFVQAKPGEDAALAGAIGQISALAGSLSTMLSVNVRVP